MIILYSTSLFLLLLTSYAHKKTSNTIGMQPIQGTTSHSIYSWFGGGLSSISIILLLGWGFFMFSWWVPVMSLLGGLFVASLVYDALPLGATYVIIGFPLGVVLAITLIIISN